MTGAELREIREGWDLSVREFSWLLEIEESELSRHESSKRVQRIIALAVMRLCDAVVGDED